jgi:hypothetical protein
LSKPLIAVRDASAKILENTTLAEVSAAKAAKRRKFKAYYSD